MFTMEVLREVLMENGDMISVEETECSILQSTVTADSETEFFSIGRIIRGHLINMPKESVLEKISNRNCLSAMILWCTPEV